MVNGAVFSCLKIANRLTITHFITSRPMGAPMGASISVVYTILGIKMKTASIGN